jgi:hypothetical protein
MASIIIMLIFLYLYDLLVCIYFVHFFIVMRFIMMGMAISLDLFHFMSYKIYDILIVLQDLLFYIVYLHHDFYYEE